MRRTVLILLCLVSLAAVWFFWPAREHFARLAKSSVAPAGSIAAANSAAPKKFTTLNTANPLALRLSNTSKSLKQLVAKPHAILLQNALIDTDAKVALNIPANLRATNNPGAYIVQARGLVDAHFRGVLTAVGAQVVSYIPNNAYLIHASASAAALLKRSPLVQTVLPFEPYYKLQPSLLHLAVAQEPLPPGTALNLGLFASDATAEDEVIKSGAKIIGRDRSAFGPVLRVLAPNDWTALAQLPGVQAVEPARQRKPANDISRVTLGVSPDTTSGATNDWLGLTGMNVLVAVNDTGVDATHPDFSATGTAASGPIGATRVFGAAADLLDTSGHGTHVAGSIAGNGSKSLMPVNVGAVAEGSVTNADFRGKAPLATLYSINFNQSDYVLQTNAAMQGALISNNSWDNGDPQYDLEASSYDLATRDALPFATGSSPVLFVFDAGGGGSGNNEGALGASDTIMSPGTAKNVITVGALEQPRNITNIVTTVINGVTNQSAVWQGETDSGTQVAAFSSRGNVGIGTEGAFGRFKPDVVAPGTFVVSTRSSQWDTNAYYSNTNSQTTPYQFQIVATNSLQYYNVAVPPNAVGVTINITANQFSPTPLSLPIYANLSATPTAPADFVGNNTFAVPPGGNGVTLSAIANGGFNFAIGNNTNQSVNYNVTVTVTSTNNVGDYFQVLEGMNDSLGGFYRYETGTSMAAAGVSGVLALMQDYFTNTLKLTPSPALLKAMLINGARSVGGNIPAVTNGINLEGWGLPSLANSLPLTTNSPLIAGTNSQLFFVDQNPATALATGDAHTYTISLNTNSDAQFLNLYVTLVWTDPAGDPNAAVKLVNNLDLVVTNLDTLEVYYGNDISPDTGFNQASSTNASPNLDTINNVEQVILAGLLAGNYSVTILGRDVNVNAVTAQTNNVVQDYALVVSCVGDEVVPDAFSATDAGGISNPTTDQNVTFVTSTNSPLFDQFAGENSPLLGTGNLPIGTNTVWGPNGVVTIGQTNQWHFYVVTNNAVDASGFTSDVTNAAFITFNSTTLSIPRMGAFADSVADATRPDADIDVYVTTDSSLTNLNPVVISNCLAATIIPNTIFNGASLGQGGTEFVVDTNSHAGEVYFVGVKSEDHMGSEYTFLPVFTSVPFSSLDQNGNQIINGMLMPVQIPDGDNAHPGVANVYALALYPMQISKVIVTNLNEHQNFGDLFGALAFDGAYDVLNNHDGLHNTFGTSPIIYDDSRNPIAGSVRSDGPGSLENFRGKSTPGFWDFTELDNALTQTGQVRVLTMKIQPHRNLDQPGIPIVIPAGGFFVDFVDVSPGYTNLTFFATNLPPTITPALSGPIQMIEKLGNEPTLTDFDQIASLTNCPPGFGTYPTGTDPGNSISVGPPLNIGRYFIAIYNPSLIPANVLLSASLGQASGANDNFNFASGSSTPLLDDAVSTSTITVPNNVTQLVASVNVGLVVNTPRISDLTFTLVSPTGQSVLLMENRGGADTNGAGAEFVYTNILNSTATGNAAANTNYLPVNPLGGTVPITYNFYTVPDEMTVYEGTNPANFYLASPDFLYDTGFTNNVPAGPGAQNTQPVTINVSYPPGISNITIIMNQFGNPFASSGDAWTYTAGAAITNFEYLVFTDDTNQANVPIKFGQPPFNFAETATNFTLSDFESATNGDYFGPTNIFDAFGGWTVPTNLVTISTVFSLTNQQNVLVTNLVVLTNNEVSVISDPSDSIGDNVGSNFLALAYGTITRSIPTIPGRIYNVTFWYRGPGIAAWWRGEGNATDSSDPEKNANNGALVGRFNFPAGEVGQAFGFQDGGNQFQFAGTNTYVQFPQSPSLDVGKDGGFTIEGWINPTNVAQPQPLVEWLAHVPTNTAVTNIVIVAGPFLDPATSHFYYLLGATNATTSELWATQLGGHLATIDTANEQNWVFDNFANYSGANHNLWIGLTNTAGTSFVWSSGLTNITYTNWIAGQPKNTNGTQNYTFIFGNTNLPSGNWTLANNGGVVQGSPTTNIVYGVAEVNDIQTNGVQFWVSVTNSMPGGTNTLVSSNGCLYANLIDTTNGFHEIYSAPGLIQSNIFQHVALTYNTNSGIAALYLNGTNVATTNLGVFVPKTGGDVLLGRDMTRYTNNYFGGEMDEMSIYSRALSDAEITAIYRVSATATNGLTGKFDPSVTPEPGLAEAEVTFGTTSNLIFGVNNQWQANSYTFTATSNSMPLQITGIEPGILLDSFTVSEAPLTNLYFLPEQALSTLAGDQASGTWTLQIWDNRVGAYLTNSSLVSWNLDFILQSNAQVAASIQPQTPTPSTVGPGQTVYYLVNVPNWAQFATNILVSSTLPVDLLFNPTNLPTGSNPGDLTLLTASTAGVGSPTLAVNSPFPLAAANQAGTSYYLGVRNSGASAASVVLEVDYDITALTNGIPYSSVVGTNAFSINTAIRYFTFAVSSNAYEATFQLLNLSGNADLVVRKGVPLPVLTNTDYGSFNATNAGENIYVLTNSSPVPLSAGTWYLGVILRDPTPVSYTVLAKELDITNSVTNFTVIDLTNATPVNFTAGPGAALTNFFRFSLANNPSLTNAMGLRFQLYNLSGNGDLTVQTNTPPLFPPFFQTSQNPGKSPEIIVVQTNSALTNLAADWYLGVPNNEITNISYTIVAAIDTNGYFPAFPSAAGAGGGAAGGGGPGTIVRHGTNGTVYHVINLNDSGSGSLRDAVSSTNRTVVFDVSGNINLASPLVITNSYLTIAGQTAPGGGITVAGQMTALQSAHDVIIRDLRFRRGSADDSLMLTNVSTVIADHVSAAWSDTVLSTLNSSNVTVQWSIMSETVSATNNSSPVGSLLRYGNGSLSFHHNLYADDYSGGPRLGDNITLDFVNNVIFGWATNAGFSLDDSTNNPSGFTNQLNYVCNYLIAGSNTLSPTIAFRGGTTNTWIFQTNNFIDSNTNGILEENNTQWAMFTNQFTKFSAPFSVIPVPTDEAFLAYEKVLDFAGVNMGLRDSVDTNIVTKVRRQSGTISSNSPLSGMVAWWKGENNPNDSVGTNNGTLVNGATYTNGEVGSAFSFNGANQYVKVPRSPSINSFGNQLTIEFWMKADPSNRITSTFQGLVDTDHYGVEISNGTGGNTGVNFFVDTGNGSFLTSAANTGGIPISAGVWHHIAGVYDGAKLQLYFDGHSQGNPEPASGVITPMLVTSFLGIGSDDGRTYCGCGGRYFWGIIDEASLYKRALSSGEIASIYNAGSAGKFAQPAATLPYLDTDRDGLPDFWEITFGQNPTNASNNQLSTNANYLGYTDLEEYDNWLAIPHSLDVTNTPVAVDIYELTGNSGNLSYLLTNAINGTVYLTNIMTTFVGSTTNTVTVTNTGPFSNSFAIFTPTNNYSGYASFGYYVTNNDTIAYFGPVTVSVVVSSVPITYGSVNTNLPPMLSTNVLGSVNNSTNINEITLLTVTNTATEANTNLLPLTYSVYLTVDTNAMNLLGWTNSFANTTNTTPSIDTNGVITWTPSEAQGPGVYIVTTIASDSSLPPLTATNSFSVTVYEVNAAPFWPTNVPGQTNYTVPQLTTLIVTNTAMDSDLPTNPLTYTLMITPPPLASAVTNAFINPTNGIITWTPSLLQLPGVYTFTTTVADTNQYAAPGTQVLSTNNTFTVTVLPVFAPFVFTQPAQLVMGASAQLNGMVTPNGLPTIAWFQWGTNMNYSNQTPFVSVGNSFNVVYTNSLIAGLSNNVAYHFRLVASNAVGVVYGFDQTLDEANVVAWGANYVNQLNVPSGLSNVVAVAGAYEHSLALKSDSTVVAWGDNTFGQANVPTNLNNVLAVAGGQYYSMALKNGGTITAWGANILNQTNVPAGLNNVVMIAGGTISSLALKNNGAVVAWGANFSNLTNVPASLSNAVAVASGGYHNLAVKNDGTVVAWGDNSSSQTTIPASVTNVVAIAAGSIHSLALRKDGSVVAWGDDSAGQIDVPAVALTNVVAVAAGGYHSIALKNDGSLVTWGDDSAGQRDVPLGLTNFVAISAGYFHSLALTPQAVVNLTNTLNFTNGAPQSNNIVAGGVTFLQVNVPTNADIATNSLLSTLNGSLNVWFTTNAPPSIATNNATLLIFGIAGVSILTTASTPTNIVPGATYYLGIQNTNSITVSYAIEVDFHLTTNAPVMTVPISSIIATNIGPKFGFWLTWFAPSNDLFQVQWSPTLVPANWTTFTNPPSVSYNANIVPVNPTNAQFNFFDDGTQTGGFGPTRFYRLILLQTSSALTLPTQTNLIVSAGNNVTVTNTATDSRTNVSMTYSLISPPAGATINTTNGVITWTNANPTGLAARFTTVVVDNGAPVLAATNAFTIFVMPFPSITNLTMTATNTTLKWSAPTNDVFNVQWTTNLMPPINWTLFPQAITSTNGVFSFIDTNAPFLTKFYQLILLP